MCCINVKSSAVVLYIVLVIHSFFLVTFAKVRGQISAYLHQSLLEYSPGHSYIRCTNRNNLLPQLNNANTSYYHCCWSFTVLDLCMVLSFTVMKL